MKGAATSPFRRDRRGPRRSRAPRRLSPTGTAHESKRRLRRSHHQSRLSEPPDGNTNTQTTGRWKAGQDGDAENHLSTSVRQTTSRPERCRGRRLEAEGSRCLLRTLCSARSRSPWTITRVGRIEPADVAQEMPGNNISRAGPTGHVEPDADVDGPGRAVDAGRRSNSGI